jgi:hypothetical protein
MNPALDKASLVNQFWSEVEGLLVEKFHHPRRTAQQGVNKYKQEIAKHHFEDAVYNRGEEQAAIVVDDLIRKPARAS